MTYAECAKLLAIAAAAYDQPIGDPDALVAAWHMVLEDVPPDAAADALKEHLRENKWFPKPAEIRQRVVSHTGAIPDPYDAWEMVMKHIKENGYIRPVPFVAPKPVAEAVNAIGGIAAIRKSERPDKDRDAFVHAYQTYAARAARDLDVVLALEPMTPAIGSGE